MLHQYTTNVRMVFPGIQMMTKMLKKCLGYKCNSWSTKFACTPPSCLPFLYSTSILNCAQTLF